ncbi:MAG: helix-turn-helix domain-containing protein [Nesterenkonia sp.]|uniref:helix-turn-helix domain-containing protein n=1 Tax=Nesterenkonia marinintestina TaxID=2979865 RepID=UPI0021BF3D7A|nr:helix-turn-helix domain-containing protein [Nesterenkonia sp. GX14115]MDO5492576.1 helix-turn-helix domain-containing protein [Nesterenkonia sp.]
MRRFLTLSDVAESLNISMSAIRGLVRSGELEAIQVGGRGQWRVEEAKLDEYIEARYAEQAAARGEADRSEVGAPAARAAPAAPADPHD